MYPTHLCMEGIFVHRNVMYAVQDRYFKQAGDDKRARSDGCSGCWAKEKERARLLMFMMLRLIWVVISPSYWREHIRSWSPFLGCKGGIAVFLAQIGQEVYLSGSVRGKWIKRGGDRECCYWWMRSMLIKRDRNCRWSWCRRWSQSLSLPSAGNNKSIGQR